MWPVQDLEVQPHKYCTVFHSIMSGFIQAVPMNPVNITITSKWARWCLKSPASRLFTQPFIQGAGQRKHQSSVSLTFVRGIHWSPMNSLHKGPVTRKLFPFDDVTMISCKQNHSQTTPWASSHPFLHPRAGWLPLRPHSAVAWLAAGRLILF